MIDWGSFFLGMAAAAGLLVAGIWIAVFLYDLKEWIEKKRREVKNDAQAIMEQR